MEEMSRSAFSENSNSRDSLIESSTYSDSEIDARNREYMDHGDIYSSATFQDQVHNATQSFEGQKHNAIYGYEDQLNNAASRYNVHNAAHGNEDINGARDYEDNVLNAARGYEDQVPNAANGYQDQLQNDYASTSRFLDHDNSEQNMEYDTSKKIIENNTIEQYDNSNYASSLNMESKSYMRSINYEDSDHNMEYDGHRRHDEVIRDSLMDIPSLDYMDSLQKQSLIFDKQLSSLNDSVVSGISYLGGGENDTKDKYRNTSPLPSSQYSLMQDQMFSSSDNYTSALNNSPLFGKSLGLDHDQQQGMNPMAMPLGNKNFEYDNRNFLGEENKATEKFDINKIHDFNQRSPSPKSSKMNMLNQIDFEQQANFLSQNRSPPSNALLMSSCHKRESVVKSPFLFKKPMTPTPTKMTPTKMTPSKMTPTKMTPTKMTPTKMTPTKIEKNSRVEQSQSKHDFNQSSNCRSSNSPFKKGQSNIGHESRSRNKGFMKENERDNIFVKSPEYQRSIDSRGELFPSLKKRTSSVRSTGSNDFCTGSYQGRNNGSNLFSSDSDGSLFGSSSSLSSSVSLFEDYPLEKRESDLFKMDSLMSVSPSSNSLTSFQENKEDGDGELDLVRVVSRIEHDHTLSRQELSFLNKKKQEKEKSCEASRKLLRLQKKELLELELEIKTLDLDAAKYDVELENEFSGGVSNDEDDDWSPEFLMKFIKMFEGVSTKMNVFSFMHDQIKETSKDMMQKFTEEWKESESLFGYDKLIKDALATVEYLDKEIDKIKPREEMADDFGEARQQLMVLHMKEKDIQEDIEIVTKLMIDQNIFEEERLAKKKMYEEMQARVNNVMETRIIEEERMARKRIQDAMQQPRVNNAMGLTRTSEYQYESVDDLTDIFFSSQM